MANMLNADKERVVYAEWSDARNELAELREVVLVRADGVHGEPFSAHR